MIDRFPSYRGLISAAWNILRKLEEAEPCERAMVMPSSLFQAAVALALLWQWPKFAGALLLGFHGLLRPSEFVPLRRHDLILPRDVMSSEAICYVKVLHSKTSRFMLRQHARISDAVSVRFLDPTFGGLASHEPLFGCSLSLFRSRWNKLFQLFGCANLRETEGCYPQILTGIWCFLVVPHYGRHLPHSLEGAMASSSHLGALFARRHGPRSFE